MKVVQSVADALGDSSYLVVGAGVAAAVDPQRDIRPLLKAAADHGASIEYVFETHVHNDYLSGARELAERGAKVVVPAQSGFEFPHLPLADGDEISFGGVSMRALLTPGHTYHHTSYLGADSDGKVRGAFTGGALLMASAGRSDLLGPEHTQELTRMQWESARRIGHALSPEAEILPTHGAGSFCTSTGGTGERRGPLAVEFGRNPALTTGSFEDFAAIHLAALAPIPGYYQYMAPINRRGPKVYGEPPLPMLVGPDEVKAALREHTWVIDVRRRQDFVTAHIPGSVEIEDSTSLLAYVGWLLPFNAPIVLVSYDRAQAERITVDLFRIGYEDVRGYMPWAAWAEAAQPVQRLEGIDIREARNIREEGRLVTIDTRFAYEQEQRPLPEALRMPLDQLNDWAGSAPETAMIVCASGQRSTMAASFLQRAGKKAVSLVEGGAEDLM